MGAYAEPMHRRMKLPTKMTKPLHDIVRLLSKCDYPTLCKPSYFKINIFRVAEKSGVCKL